MNRRNRGWLVALAAGLLLAPALWLRYGGLVTAESPQSPGGAGIETEITTAAQADAELRRDEAASHLPPANVPLEHKLERLQSRADAGNRKAACRLGMELLTCEFAARWQETVEFNSRAGFHKAAQEFDPVLADGMDKMQLRHLETLMSCRAVPESLRSAGAHYLTQAARAGEPEAMLRYALGEHWQSTGRGIYVGAEFDAWRRDAPGMMWRALEAGVPEAAIHLQFAHRPGFGIIGALTDEDPLKAHAFKLLGQMLFGSNPPMVPIPLDAEGQIRARDMAEDWHQRYFGGRQYPGKRWRHPFDGHAPDATEFCP